MISALDVAWYFVQKGEGDPSITQLKLQKLCYYAQGFYLAAFGKPLFHEAIEAWDHGPVVVELRQVHSHRGAETISPYEPAFGDLIQASLVTEHLDRVWEHFGHYSAGELVNLTHAESPWIEAHDLGQNTRISEGSMLSFFIKEPCLSRDKNLGLDSQDQKREIEQMRASNINPSQLESLYDTSPQIRELSEVAAAVVAKRADQKRDDSWIKQLAEDIASFDD